MAGRERNWIDQIISSRRKERKKKSTKQINKFF
jgi:hypothetical protein